MKFVIDNIWLILAAVASGGMLLWPLISGRFSGANEVDTMEAVQLINRKDALVLDVRDEGEYASGHIPNARHIPLGKINERLRELEKFKAKPIVVHCRTGTMSAKACGVLRKNGFTNVHNLRGGIAAWQEASLPVQK